MQTVCKQLIERLKLSVGFERMAKPSDVGVGYLYEFVIVSERDIRTERSRFSPQVGSVCLNLFVRELKGIAYVVKERSHSP